MIVETAALWAAATNCYVVAAGRGEQAVLVDAPPDPDGIAELVKALDVAPVALLSTHGHVDHIGGAGSVERAYGLTAYLHPDDSFLADDPATQLRLLFGMVPPGDHEPPERYEALEDGQMLSLADIAFGVLHTPGHTPGHCCFRVEDDGLLFSGDQLFAGSIGRTDLPGGDFDTLMASMERQVVSLPGETTVLPGHGPATTIARELETNPFLEPFRP